MPKLVHKDKVTRLKTYNYTEKHDKLQKNLSSGKVYPSKSQALLDAGYSQVDSPDNSKGVQELVKDWKLPQIAVANFKRAATIEEDTDKDTRENIKLKLDAGTLILKLSGDLKDRSVSEMTLKGNLSRLDDEGLRKIVEEEQLDGKVETSDTGLGIDKTPTANGS